MSTLQEFKEDLALFVEGGLLAIKQGDELGAKKLFNAAAILDPEGGQHQMGYGLIALHKMELPEAKNNFEELIKLDKTNWRAQSFLAFAHMLSVFEEEASPENQQASLEKAASLATEVLEKSDSDQTRQVAQSIIDWQLSLQAEGAKKRGPAG